VIPPEQVTPVPAAPQDGVQPAPAEKAPGEPEAEKKGAEGDGEEKRQRTDRFNRRIGQLTQQRNDERARNQALLAENDRLRRSIRPENVETLDYDQREALRTREAIRAEKADETLSQAAQADDASKAATAEIVATKLEDANDPALALLLNDSSFPITDDVVEFLAETDQAVDIAKHLVANPQLARKLAEMTFRGNGRHRGSATRASMREADRILVGLEARFKAGPLPTGRAATKAPAPGTTLNGGAPPKIVVPLNEVNDNAEYIARRQAAWAKGQP